MKKIVLAFFVFLISASYVFCTEIESDGNNTDGELVKYELVSFDKKTTDLLFKPIVQSFDWTVKSKRYGKYSIDSYKITYKIKGSDQNLTGLLMCPATKKSKKILLFTHPTEPFRGYSPSSLKPFHDGTLTKPFGRLFSQYGFAVVIPDYPGMGDNNQTHPFNLKELGYTSVAMVDAIKQLSKKENVNIKLKEKDLSIMGFSEGGYAALASAHYITHLPEHKFKEYGLKKVVSLSGAYDLNKTMKNFILREADEKYPRPYFFAYMLNGISAMYPSTGIDMNNSVVQNPSIDGAKFNTKLYAMLFGDHNGDAISNMMKKVEPYKGPISITTEQVRRELADDNSPTGQALTLNTLVDKRWELGKYKGVEFFFGHYKKDDCVPVGNTVAVEKIWGDYPNVIIKKYRKVTRFIDILPLLTDTTHHSVSIVSEYKDGLRFILDESVY